MDSSFISDPQLQQVASQSAEECIAFLKQKFGKNADYSDRFVTEVEDVMNLLQLDIPRSKPPENVVQEMATVFGSYIGETYRLNHGGEWGIANGSPALQTRNGITCYPWMRAWKRLTNGYEDNVLHWYQYLLQHGSTPSGPPPLPTTPPPLPSQH